MKTHYLKPTMTPIGILGGGQLARMMVLKAHEMGLPVAVFSENRLDPAAQITPQWQKGRLTDTKALREFLKSCSLVTFESEFLDAEMLDQLRSETKTPIFPTPKHMAVLQDRFTQKKSLLKWQLPTLPSMPVDNDRQAIQAMKRLGPKVVFKKRRFGYDGYGTFVIHTPKQAEKFLPQLKRDDCGYIVEPFLRFRREIAIILARGRTGEIQTMPYVETYQENSRCLWVKGPLPESKPLRKLRGKLQDFLEAMGYVGVMGVEIFDTNQGLFINEVAPRVHNSGHYSLNGMNVDQFSLHLRAILGAPLPRPVPLKSGFAMLNLLGSSKRVPKWTLAPDIFFHWYGKTDNRVGRKMGHINALGPTPEKALLQVMNRRKDFHV